MFLSLTARNNYIFGDKKSDTQFKNMFYIVTCSQFDSTVFVDVMIWFSNSEAVFYTRESLYGQHIYILSELK